MGAGEKKLVGGRKLAPESLGRVLVLGLGVSGRACADYLLGLLGTRVASVSVAAGAAGEEARAWADAAAARGAEVTFGTEEISGRYDLCVASPGISEFSEFYLNAARASGEVISEVEFAWRESRADSRWVAVTGTNGKTTTTALSAHVLRACGMRARAVGNIGDTCIEAVAADDAEVYVAEVSSYQLASTRAFAPDVAVVLNITPDHVKWHRTHENYAAAKWKVLANLGGVPGGVAVLDATDEEVRARVRELKALSREERGFDYVPVGTSSGVGGDMRAACGADNAAFAGADGRLHVALRGTEHVLVAQDELQIKGAHNVGNALSAAACAVALGGDDAAIARGLASFAPLEHRIEPCGEVAGIACYNDSKATNVDAVLKALAAFEPARPVILLGGRDKGTDLGPLVNACRAHAKGVVCFGEASMRFYAAFLADAAEGCGTSPCPSKPSSRSEVRFVGLSGQSEAPQPPSLTLSDLRDDDIPVVRVKGMEAALDAGLALSQAGDVLVLSPACASFDEFSCFQERGRVFKQLVSARAARAAR